MPYDRSAFITRTAQEDIAFDFSNEQESFLHDKIFPAKKVDKADTKVYQADTSKLRLMNTRKKTNSEVDLVDENLFSRNITLVEHKLGAEINPMDVRDGDIKSMLDEGRKIKIVTLALMLQKENLAATLATTVANYPSDLTSAIASGSRWNEAGGTPEADKVTVDNALVNRCGRKANAVAMGGDTFRKLKLSPEFRDRVKYTSGSPVTLEAIKAFFDVEHAFIGDARYDSAVEGATASIGSFWGSNVLFFVHNPSPHIEDVSFGHMYHYEAPFWTKVTVDERRNGPAGSMKRVEVGSEYAFDKGIVVSSSDSDFAAGYLFRTAVA